MNIQKSKLGHGIFAFMISMMSAFSAHADDTEIFFGGSSDISIKPNVLFILDTSGSMKGTDNTTTTRLDRMKTAFTTLLSGMNNVNVGLMRFNDPGGPILYPITDIDQTISESQSGNTSSRVNSSNSDAEESSGVVSLSNNTLEITSRTSTGSPQTVVKSVTASKDDAEETLSNNDINYTSDGLETPYDDSDAYDRQSIGFIFRDMDIPKDANIISARIDFTIEYKQGGRRRNPYRRDLNVKIEGELNSTILDFDDQDISSRTKTSSSVSWQITDSPNAGGTLESPDVSSLIQEMVNQADWDADSDAALFIDYDDSDTPNAKREFSSYDSRRAPPVLTVQYEEAVSSTAQTIGLRFADVDVPQGAIIQNASLQFTAANTHSDTTAFTIEVETSDNSAEFTTASNDISSRTTTSQVSWTPSSWNDGEVYSKADDGVDITSILQEVIDRANWCGGNALSVIITGSGHRSAVSYDGNASEAPVLNIEYDPDSIPASPGGCVSSELSYRINATSDDVEHAQGDYSSNGNKLTIGDNHGDNQALGLRFSNVQIPSGSTISSAYLEFNAYENAYGTANFTIYGENSDNPETYSTTRKPLNLSTIATNVAWSNVESWSTSQTYRSPDISSIIQALVNRGGWAEGNAISLIVEATDGARHARSYENDASSAVRLVIRASGVAGQFEETTRDVLTEIVNNLSANGPTPIVDTLYEAARYYRGEGVHWGTMRGDNNARDSNRQNFRVSHADSYTGGQHNLPAGCSDTNSNDSDCIDENISGSATYISPITNQCQPNHIILLTDGEPNGNESESLIHTLIGANSCTDNDDGTCGPELTEYLFTTDNNANIPGTNTIKTHTIGFNIADEYLGDLANGGDYYTASSSADLLDVFQEILRTTLNIDTTFVSPGVTVNSFNRLTHRSEIYFSLFQPQETPHWPGNLKRYKITSDGDILDKNGDDAIDDQTGYFKDTAVSFWNTVQDGNDTAEGGAARKLPAYATRNLYTHYSGSSSNSLTHADNAISVANKANISKSLLSIDSETNTYHENLIDWVRGKDVNDVDGDNVTDEDRKQLSDPLHSSPHLVIYGGTDDAPDITIFYGDNEGFLHAINAATGVEYFAFAPEELLPNFNKLFSNSGAIDHPYGLDGPVTAWVKDIDADSTIEPDDGEHVYVYAGMRRGGRNYYALNVTDRSQPSVLWKITGGSGDFTDLGQTWARPIKTKINVDGTTREVLIISGGYDTQQDSVTTRTADAMGNAIFIVDASTGQKIWSVGDGGHDLNLNAMDYSIPATVRAIDVNSDGFADQMYVGDMGGQLWRFDITNGNPVSSLVTGGVIADLAGNNASTARRFYHEPDISVSVKNGVRQLAIAIGSGYQAHPLDTGISDRFFVIYQSDVSGAPADANSDGIPDYVTLTESNLFDTTSNEVENGTNAEIAAARTALAAANGWYIDMLGEVNGSNQSGEKVLSRALTFGGVVYFSTYQPSATISANCTISPGLSKLYTVNLSDGTPASLENGDGTDTSDRYTTLLTSGLPPDPVHLRISDNNGLNDLVSVGTEIRKMPVDKIVTKTYWHSE